MKRIMLLSPCDIFPPVHGSSTAIYHTIKHISENNLIRALIAHVHSEDGQIDLHIPNVSFNYYKPILKFLGYRALLVDPRYFYVCMSNMNSFRGDIIQCELLWTAPVGMLLRKKFKKPMILVQENVEFLKFRRFGFSLPMICWIKYLEKMSCQTADHIVAVSEVDKKFIMKLYGIGEEKISIIHHCVDHNVFNFNPDGRNAVREKLGLDGFLTLCFVGKLDYIPNVKAVKFIAEKIFPEIMRNCPKSKFLVIGQNFESLKHYQNENIIFTGFVDSRETISPNLKDFLSASDIVLVPLESGSGTRLKILEAAACSRPIISTKIGAEGQDFIDEEEIILTQLPNEEFIDAVLQLIKNKEKMLHIGEKARLKVLQKYTWEKETKKFEDIYNRVSNQNK